MLKFVVSWSHQYKGVDYFNWVIQDTDESDINKQILAKSVIPYEGCIKACEGAKEFLRRIREEKVDA